MGRRSERWVHYVPPLPLHCHEVLGIVRVTARPAFGGESGVALVLETGDVAVTVAGVGQCNPRAGEGFLVVGAYLRG